MQYLGKNSQGHGFECIICQFIEYASDPNKPTTPDEKPHKSLLEYGSATTMGKNNYKR